jgi:DNA-binding GntR family transcriptional regulator
MKFANLPASDRWRALDTQLPALIAAHLKTTDIPADEEITLAELAERHACGITHLRRRLEELGVIPYRLGNIWMVRRRSYARALEAVETLESEEAPSS